jgi:acetolactate synthase-1/2/3 large subunit
VAAAAELGPALEEAFAGRGPAVVEVPVDYRENFRLIERLGQLVCPV